jgi:hypothetical protein
MSPTLNLHGTREQKNAAELDPARRWFARSAVMFAANHCKRLLRWPGYDDLRHVGPLT